MDASLNSFSLTFERYFEFTTLLPPHVPPPTLLADEAGEGGFVGSSSPPH